MKFEKLGDIADELCRQIAAGCPEFKRVFYSQAASGEQLFSEFANLTSFPAAAVCVSDIYYDDEDLARLLRFIVFVAAPFRKAVAKKAVGVWELSDRVAGLFTSHDQFGWQTRSIAPVVGDERTVVYGITIELKEWSKK